MRHCGEQGFYLNWQDGYRMVARKPIKYRVAFISLSNNRYSIPPVWRKGLARGMNVSDSCEIVCRSRWNGLPCKLRFKFLKAGAPLKG